MVCAGQYQRNPLYGEYWDGMFDGFSIEDNA